MIAKVRAHLDKTHPVINRHVAGQDRPVTDEERAQILDEWAASYLDEFFVYLRRERDALLAASDWTQFPDAPVDAKAWAPYRQALRDLPAKIKDPTAEVAWPEPPK